MNNIEQDTEYFNDPSTPNPGHPAWYPWQLSLEGGKQWLEKDGMKGNGDPGRQRLTRYPNNMPVKLQGVYDTEKADRSLSWYHKRNLTLYLVNNRQNGPYYFPGNAFSQGTINPQSGGLAPATTVVTNPSWIMCTVSLRGQARYRFNRDYNGWCWDGATTTATWAFANPANGGGVPTMRLRYFTCKIDFVGSTFVRSKRSEPIGYFDGQPIYGKLSADLWLF
jgi:hypothetical protein